MPVGQVFLGPTVCPCPGSHRSGRPHSYVLPKSGDAHGTDLVRGGPYQVTPGRPSSCSTLTSCQGCGDRTTCCHEQAGLGFLRLACAMPMPPMRADVVAFLRPEAVPSKRSSGWECVVAVFMLAPARPAPTWSDRYRAMCCHPTNGERLPHRSCHMAVIGAPTRSVPRDSSVNSSRGTAGC